MKFYLSSFRLGDASDQLAAMTPYGRIGYINNALDFSSADLKRKKAHTERELGELRALGLRAELVDLSEYFAETDALAERLNELGAVFICGGNAFVLRQAMMLSGMDEFLLNLEVGSDFLYAGYSAGPCVLSPTLRPYAIVDDATDTPYDGWDEVIWEGLNLLDFAFMPHWDSDHPESADIEKEIAFCEREGIPYRAVRDGDVIIIE